MCEMPQENYQTNHRVSFDRKKYDAVANFMVYSICVEMIDSYV